MGQGYLLRCSECRYEEEFVLGVGFMFVQENERIKEAIQEGKLGKKFQNLAIEVPGFSVKHGRKIFVCEKCGELREEMYIAMYDGDKLLLEKGYRCSGCRGKMAPSDDVKKLKCPHCGKPLTATVSLMWD